MTSAPTMMIEPWCVKAPEVAPITDFSTGLDVTYEVGPLADAITFELFNTGCETAQPLDSMTAAINLIPKAYNAGDAETGYAIDFLIGNFGDDAGGFVDQVASTGEVNFCVRVTSYEGELDVSFRDSEFSLAYSLEDNTYSILDIAIEANDADEVTDTDVGTGFTVSSCQCVDFACTSVVVEQRDPLVVCLMAEHDDDTAQASVVISNFNMRVFGGVGGDAMEYNPVTIGATSWEANDITIVNVSEDEVVMVSTLLISSFYSSGLGEVNVDGFAFLEFASASGARVFEEYGVVVEIGAEAQEGCFASLFKIVGDLF
jgi:hypothetical protein